MILQFENLTYRYDGGGFTFGPLSTSLYSDRITAIIGANGSGKSTMIKLLLRQLIEYDGHYMVNGGEEQSLTGDLLHRYNIGYLPEVPLLDDGMSGYELAELVAALRGMSEQEFSSEIQNFQKMLQIEEWYRDKRCGDYSMGMRKKSAIVLAMLGKREFMILDEPTNGLDPLAVYGLKQLVEEKHRDGAGVIITSHILDFLEKLVDEVLFLRKGAMVEHHSLKGLQAKWGKERSLDEIFFSLHHREEPIDA